MSHAEIEECEDSVVAVCPWHRYLFNYLDIQKEWTQLCARYDFDLKTGKSETGLRACTYSVEVKTNSDTGKETVYMESPEGGTHWRLIELRPVSEGKFNITFGFQTSIHTPTSPNRICRSCSQCCWK